MKKKVWILIGVIGIILFTSGGVLFFKSNQKEKEPNVPAGKPDNPIAPPVEEIKEEPVSLELAENLYQMLDGYAITDMFFNDYYQYDLVTPDIITNEDKNKMVIRNLLHYQDVLKDDENQFGNPLFTKEKIYKIKNQILGENTSFELNIGRLCMEKFEEVEENKYTFEYECGHVMFTPNIATKVSKAIKKEDKIYLDMLVIFIDYSTDNMNDWTAYYYQDYNRTISLGQQEFLYDADYFKDSSRIDWNSYQDRAGQYHFTYQINEDGTYTFLQMERIK